MGIPAFGTRLTNSCPNESTTIVLQLPIEALNGAFSHPDIPFHCYDPTHWRWSALEFQFSVRHLDPSEDQLNGNLHCDLGGRGLLNNKLAENKGLVTCGSRFPL